MRVDKWLWAARFYKTRSLASEEIGKGRVQLNGLVAKASREVKVGDELVLRSHGLPRTVRILGLSAQRGPAPQAQTLYEETPESLALAQQWQEQRRLAPEPALGLSQGRPTKRLRRNLDRVQMGEPPDGDARWRAEI
jgi:ribosome-associated heat shock protein Hsp15